MTELDEDGKTPEMREGDLIQSVIESPQVEAEVPLGQRFLKPQTIGSFVVAIGILVYVVMRLDIDMRAVWGQAKEANLYLYGIAFLLYYSTFLFRAIRWRFMLAQANIDKDHGYDIPGNGRMSEIFILSWFVNSIVPAKLGDAYRSYLLKRDSGASFSSSLGTILAERIVDLGVLFSLMTIFAAITFKGHIPGEASRTVLSGLILIVVAVIALAAMWFLRNKIDGYLPERIKVQYHRLHDAAFACLRRPWLPILLSFSVWIFDGFRLLLVCRALGADVNVATAIFVALMSSLLTTLPITPAGLGVVEAGMIVVFKLVGIDPVTAGSIALLDRVISYWSVILVGIVLYIFQFRRNLVPAGLVEQPLSLHGQ